MKRYFLVANGLEIMFQRVWYHLKKRAEDSNFATFCAKMKQNRQLIWATISPRGRTQVNWLLLWHTENSFSFGKRSRNCMEEKINNSLSCFLFQLFCFWLLPQAPHGQTKRDKIIECLSLLFEKKRLARNVLTFSSYSRKNTNFQETFHNGFSI